MTQGESRLSRQIAQGIRARGGFVFKIHGSAAMMNGLPDLFGCYRGYPIGLETKVGSNQASPAQRLRITQIRKAGGVAHVVRSVREAMAVLDAIDRELGPPDTGDPAESI